MSDRQDFLDLETRKVLNALGNAGSIIEWWAVTLDGEPIVPEILGEDPSGVVVNNSVVVIWPDESATLITTAMTNDPR